MRRFQGRRAVARTLAVWIVTAVALLALGWVSPTVEVSDVTGALAGALAIGLVNALVWPLLIRFALPFTVLTLGLGALVLNGAGGPAASPRSSRASTSTGSARGSWWRSG